MESSSSVNDDDNVYDSLLSDLDRKLIDEERGIPLNDTPSKITWKRAISLGLIATFMIWGLAFSLFAFSKVLGGIEGNNNNNNKNQYYSSSKQIKFSDVRNGTFSVKRTTIDWIKTSNSSNNDIGSYVTVNDGVYSVGRQTENHEEIILDFKEFKYNDKTYQINKLTANSDVTKAILMTDFIKHWRHSSTAKYWVYDINTKDISPVFTDNEDEPLSIATWSPTGDSIAFVYKNNLYIRKVNKHESNASGVTIQVTKDGGDSIFYGIPDWVYEEEIFGDSSALWWSPNGKFLSFLRTNDTNVPLFPIPYFVENSNDIYPTLLNIKYPKAGFENPIVDIGIFDLDNNDAFYLPSNDPIRKDESILITEVVWTGDESLLVKLTNRVSDILKVAIIDAVKRQSIISRVEDYAIDGGWYDITTKTSFVPADPENNRPFDGYLDTVPVNGFNHLAYFSPVNSSTPIILTKGSWEVVDAPSAFDSVNNKVYFLSTQKDSTERHLYSINLDGTEFSPITDINNDGYYTVSFSSGARYVLLNYNGPSIPWQKLIDLHSENPIKTAKSLEKNEKLTKSLTNYDVPTVEYSQVYLGEDEETGEDIWANYAETKPHGFDKSLKHPVLFRVYGGPGSQTVNKVFSISFDQVVASSLGVIVVSVDGRGTGFRGRKYRSIVRERLGYFEPKDQISAAKAWAKKDYVDSDKIAIWGWSYGGYMTLKTLEADAGKTFKYGMSVAPVTDWRYYDSIYTERYMLTPQENSKGYENSAIHDTKSIGNATRFLVCHGTGDDNVHFQNTLTLLDKLDLGFIENYDVHIFPDSDHSISYHNANNIIYDKLYNWVEKAFNGDFL